MIGYPVCLYNLARSKADTICVPSIQNRQHLKFDPELILQRHQANGRPIRSPEKRDYTAAAE